MKQTGFTLIELVMVIVILGILAAVAVPKFVDLSTEASVAAVKGVAGGVSSGFATNYAAAAAGNAGSVAIAGNNLTVSAAAGSIVLGGLPTGISASALANTLACGAAGRVSSITIYDASNNTASATLICTG